MLRDLKLFKHMFVDFQNYISFYKINTLSDIDENDSNELIYFDRNTFENNPEITKSLHKNFQKNCSASHIYLPQ